MSLKARLELKLQNAFAPVYLEVVNESHRHAVPPGSETHFKITLVSEAFTNQSLLARQRAVNKLLAEDLAGPIHALALHTYTLEEWQAKGNIAPKSPPCHNFPGPES